MNILLPVGNEWEGYFAQLNSNNTPTADVKTAATPRAVAEVEADDEEEDAGAMIGAPVGTSVLGRNMGGMAGVGATPTGIVKKEGAAVVGDAEGVPGSVVGAGVVMVNENGAPVVAVASGATTVVVVDGGDDGVVMTKQLSSSEVPSKSVGQS